MCKRVNVKSGPSSNDRGLFSFVNQYIHVCDSFRDEKDVDIFMDLGIDNSYYDCQIKDIHNVWDYFFLQKTYKETYSSNIDTFWGDGGTANRYGYDFDFSNTEERILVKELIDKNLILKPQIKDKIELFYKENFYNKKVLGIHKRGTDIGMHHRIIGFEEYCQEIYLIKDEYDTIFITTDERVVVDNLKERYNNVISYSYDTLSNSNDKPSFKMGYGNTYKMGEDTIVDAYLLSKTDFLIKPNSNLSNFALLNNSNLKYKSI